MVYPTWIAPNAQITGEVIIDRFSAVWYNAVIRGDLNRIRIDKYASIGEGTVISTVASLPTGLTADVEIGRYVTIHPNCVLTSCEIEN